MTLPTLDTIVSYPAGATSGTATVLHVGTVTTEFGTATVVLLDATPVHPVDAGWPDQPSDRATLAWTTSSGEALVATLGDAIVAATDGESLHLGRDIPVRKGTEGWAFVVAHVLEAGAPAPVEGDTVTVEVDADYRRALSLGHTACHLVSLALSRALADRWSKEVRPDALGAPNFDAEANDTSRILERASVDTYRLGKSLRKKGFSTEGIADALPALEAEITATLTAWAAAGGAVRIDRDGDRLTDRRSWVCSLPEGEARIPCGGTHAHDLAELAGLRAELSLADVEGTPVLTLRTTVG